MEEAQAQTITLLLDQTLRHMVRDVVNELIDSNLNGIIRDRIEKILTSNEIQEIINIHIMDVSFTDSLLKKLNKIYDDPKTFIDGEKHGKKKTTTANRKKK